ncbi:120_t:CDS:2 [Dentiscutata erythropus]|uniref:120_t:CDS:1 n=1 Tax=Dentiscutata erythropus TaxID=1348616 RepID=A0A9N9EDE0_9GLOM|nr:120_t:CDS:2 [Dentiscutata erythropus]
MSKVDNDASSSSNPLISIWALLEGYPSSAKINVKPSDFISQCPDLNNFKQILNQEYETLKDVEPDNIDFFSDKDRTQTLLGGVLLADLVTTASCPLIVRYPLSTSSIIVTYKSENSEVKCQLPHSSGSWDLLRKDVIKNFSKLSHFENTKVDDLYFEISDEENFYIENEFQFNMLVKRIEEKKKIRVLPDLKVQIKDKRPYNEWDIEDVFKNVLHQYYDGSLDYAFNLDKLPSYNSITEEEMKFFVENIKKTGKVFKYNINVNEATAREYISIFMKTAVKHIQEFTNNSAQLYVKADLYGSKGYGPVDYLVKLDDFAVLVNGIGWDFTNGIAQNIMQLHSASEKFESSQQLFGIVTNGITWYFIRWTGSPEKPKAEISHQYNCVFEGEMQSAKNIVSYIVRILENQDDMLRNNLKRACID